jgi:2,3-bisphosphoglycerate-dependent phosphoglycerate mutase
MLSHFTQGLRASESAPLSQSIGITPAVSHDMYEREKRPRTLVLLRHGESTWNQQNRFTGWTDADLTEKGREQARQAGSSLRHHGFQFDVAYTSVLKRAIRTLWIALDELDLMWIPTYNCWRLNERHYGALQGLDKSAAAVEFGTAQVKQWRRSYEEQPPLVDVNDSRYPGHDPRYRTIRPHELPMGESLKDTGNRLWPCWQHSISAALRLEQKVFVVAHGNSLRALVKHLDTIGDADIADVEIPYGIPLVYEFTPDLTRIGSYYLVESDTAETTRQETTGDKLHTVASE